MGVLQPQNIRTVRSVVRLGLIAFATGMVASAFITLLVDRDAILAILPEINPLMLTVPFGLYLAINVMDSLRLRMVLHQFHMRVPFRVAFANSVIGVLFNNITPAGTGGHPFQIYHLKFRGIPAKTATNIILSRHVERLISQAAITLAAVPVVLQVAATLEFGRGFIFAGVGLVTLLALFLLVILARPDFVAAIALRLSHRKLNGLITRITGKPDWPEQAIHWTREMRAQVAYLWNQRTLIMFVDSAVGVLNMVFQGLSMWFMITVLTGASLPVFHTVLTWIVVNQLVYYVPTPGASGSVEGMHTLVFAAVTGRPELTFVAVVLWRFATYYLHIVFGGFVFAGFLRNQNRNAGKITPEIAGDETG
ncbi:MAG: lysylphosphatidylglycerol synthase transmembrane domain-containing protein [Spirochaetota bacterium]